MEAGSGKRTQLIFNHFLIKIIIGVLLCLIVPVIVKVAILIPIFGVFDITEDTSKIFQGLISTAVILFAYVVFIKKNKKRKVPELSISNITGI